MLAKVLYRIRYKQISYNKLWKMLIDRGLKRTDLKTVCEISSASIAKLGKNENITTGVLTKICKGLQCDISNIMEMIDVKEMARKDKSEE